MDKLQGIPELDKPILYKLDRATLLKLCETDPYVLKLCNTDEKLYDKITSPDN